MSLFTLKAGYRALETIREGGLSASQVKVIAGAAGGPKWIVLGGLDRYLFGEFFAGREKPLYLVGSSIATWRYAAVARKKPLDALERFREAYFAQSYSARPTAEEVTREAEKVMNAYFDDEGIGELMDHPWMRLSVLAVRSRKILSSDNRRLLLPGLATAAMGNFFSRRSLGCFFSRALFYDSRDLPPWYSMSQFPIERVPLSRENVREAVLASGSIPLAMEGIKDVTGARPGIYRDGGMIDYHLDIPFNCAYNEIVLFPHYTDRVVPGWFDKNVPWRKPDREHMAGVLLIAPSKEFTRQLTDMKIPDRHDFRHFHGRDAERISGWEKAFALGVEMADEFRDAVETGRIAELVSPLS